MDYCANHNQFYNQFCVYCGSPQIMTGVSGTNFKLDFEKLERLSNEIKKMTEEESRN